MNTVVKGHDIDSTMVYALRFWFACTRNASIKALEMLSVGGKMKGRICSRFNTTWIFSYFVVISSVVALSFTSGVTFSNPTI